MTSKASSIKIVIGFYSLLAVLEQTFAIAWPAGFERTLSNLKAAFASVLDFSSFSCAVKADWFQRVAFLCLALIAVLVALAVAFARAVSKARAADGDATEGELVPLAQPNRKGKVAFLLGKLFGVDRPPELDVEYSGKAFNVMLLVYPFLSPAAVAIFNCREVAGEFDALYPGALMCCNLLFSGFFAGEWWLQADYSLRCFDARWNWWAAVSALVCTFYVAGLPCLALVSVIRRSPSIEFIAAGLRTDGGRIILGWEVSCRVLKKYSCWVL